MTGEVNKVFGESNADNVAREDEIENYLYEGEVSIDFNDIDETMYEYGENDNIRYGNYNINKASLIRNMKLDELCLISFYAFDF